MTSLIVNISYQNIRMRGDDFAEAPVLYRIIDLPLTNQQGQDKEAAVQGILMSNQHHTSICAASIPEPDAVTAEYRVGTIAA